MTKRMLIDASHADETRVVVLDGNRLEEFDIETENKRPLKGNIYLAKVIRVEPSLQAAFVEYGGNRHGFLAFGEIHPDYYQLPVADRERLLALQAAEAAEDEADDDGEEVSEAEADAMAARIERMADADEGAGTEGAASGEAEALLATEAAAAEATVPHEGVPVGDEADSSAPEAAPEMVGGRDKDEENGRDERRIPPRFLRHYKIQEVIRRRQIMLVQVVKEERGNKGAALTTYISLAGRFSVLMPNSPRGGGISRKITSIADRKRLREVIEELNMPRGMSMIVRTAGAGRPKPEIRRDCEYLLRLWDDIRERTLDSTAPALIYEEADLIKRSIRDVFGRDIEEIQVEGEGAYRQARDFMRMLMPQNDRKIRLYKDATVPLFARHGVDQQLDAMMSPVVQLKSGGYIVINQTEALVAIDVNSGRATRDRHIEDTALRTNLEAADEVARQLRLRDLAGLIVIDFIDMESSRNDAQVERRLKEALKQDRARIQVGRISHFGLLEMSRQRLRPSLTEHSFATCPHCQGLGIVRTPESSALQVLRQIEEEGAKRRAAEIVVSIAPELALHILNRRRERLAEIEARYGMAVLFEPDAKLLPPAIRIERTRAQTVVEPPSAPAALRMDYAPEAEAPAAAPVSVPEAPAAEPAADEAVAEQAGAAAIPAAAAENGEDRGNGENRRRRRRRRRRGGRREDGTPLQAGDFVGAEEPEGEGEGEEDEAEAEGVTSAEAAPEAQPAAAGTPAADGPALDGEEELRRGRRGRRGGRRRFGEGAAVEQPRPRYAGPTPADPFGGTLDDIFDAMAAAEEAAQHSPAPKPAAAPPVTPPAVPDVAPVASVAPVPPLPGAEEVLPATGSVALPGSAPLPESAPAEVAPVEVAPVEAAPVAPVEVAPVDVAVEAAPAKPRRARKAPAKAAAAAPEAAEAAVPDAEAVPAKPRRARKAPAKAAAAPEVAGAAVSDAEAVPAKPRRARKAPAKATAAPEVAEPAPVSGAAAAPEAAPVAEPEAAPAPVAVSEPAAASAPAEPEAAAPVQPVLVDALPDAPKKRGWWKR
ncbi:ribonuclease E/G [Pseudoroseomonas rhizosphaerae]|uniref:Ribonuclease E n=1 Tax=Teichococcus rhizosphaerae TaxID=1335062 RepID=A0A2C7AFS6_9PROT|nr:ribonuclease E/G [Pseudoroseomonas rhizosphaerae]PHK96006.1 ribonuclease E/G [Pseudoroseomonas rhizosphaerae]